MKKTYTYIVFILLFGLISCLIIDSLLQKGFEKSNDDVIGKLNEIINDSTYYDVVCFGSSRTLAHFNPKIIEETLGYSAFNAGVNGACIIDINLLLKSYLVHRNPPKIIIIHVDDFTFETDRLSELPRYFPYIENPIVYNTLAPFNESVSYVHNLHFLRVMYYYDLLKWISIKAWFRIEARTEYKLINGYRINKSTWNAHFEEGLENRYEEINKLYSKEEVEKPGFPLFDDVLKICKDNNIKLIFSSSPVLYGENNKLYENTTKKMEKLSSGYDVEFLWLHNESWSKEEYFYDYLHMNYKGADRYTLLLSDYIKSKNLNK